MVAPTPYTLRFHVISIFRGPVFSRGSIRQTTVETRQPQRVFFVAASYSPTPSRPEHLLTVIDRASPTRSSRPYAGPGGPTSVSPVHACPRSVRRRTWPARGPPLRWAVRLG